MREDLFNVRYDLCSYLHSKVFDAAGFMAAEEFLLASYGERYTKALSQTTYMTRHDLAFEMFDNFESLLWQQT